MRTEPDRSCHYPVAASHAGGIHAWAWLKPVLAARNFARSAIWCLPAVENVLAPDGLTVLPVLDLEPRWLLPACSGRSPASRQSLPCPGRRSRGRDPFQSQRVPRTEPTSGAAGATSGGATFAQALKVV
jgi:hypothetical protein